MGKIIKISESTVTIVFEDGRVTEYAIETLKFTPQLGTLVQLNEKDGKIEKNKKFSLDHIIAITFIVCGIAFLLYTTISQSNHNRTDSDSNITSSIEYSSTIADINSNSSGTNSSNSSLGTIYDKEKNNYKEIDYSKWNHEDTSVAYTSKVKIKGKVLQVGKFEDGTGMYLRVATNNNYDQIVFVEILLDNYLSTITEDDEIAIYGRADGRYTYETTLGNELTIPYMEGYFYNLNEEVLNEEIKNFEIKTYYNQNGITFEQLTNDTFRVTNNSSQTISIYADSIDVNGQVTNSFNLIGLYGDLRPSQNKIAVLKDSDGNMKKGATINIYIKINDDFYHTIAEFTVSYILTDDIKSKY